MNKELDNYLEAGDYEKVDEVSRELCHLQGLEPADKMPEDFLFRLERREQKEMKHIKKISKNFTKIAAAVAGVLLIGGTVSAATIYHSYVIMFPNGMSTGNVDTETKYEFEGIELPDGEVTTKVIEQETADINHAWLEKKVWDEVGTAYESDDRVNWTPYEVVDRITEYKYPDYNTAAKDAGFTGVFTKDYSGTAYYREYEHVSEEVSDNTDCVINADFIYSDGSFTLEQQRKKYNDAAAQSEDTLVVITGDTTHNERAYVSSSGYEYKLADDNEFEKTRTTVLIPGREYDVILTFTDITETEIYNILESINIKTLVNF